MPEPTEKTGARPDGLLPPPIGPGGLRPTVTAPPPQGAGGSPPPAPPSELETEVEAAPTRKLGVLGWLCIGWLGLIVAMAMLAPILPLQDPDENFSGHAWEGPIGLSDLTNGTADWSHPFGFDETGRDMFSRVIFGARASLFVSVSAIAIGIVVGGFLGLVAGYLRGWVDTVANLLFNVFLSIPGLVLAMALIAVLAPDGLGTSPQKRMNVIVLALAIVAVAPLGRIARGATISWSERDFVKAAEVSGARPWRIMFREVLPNVLPALFSLALLSVAVVIVIESALSILNIGVTGVPSWGSIIGRAWVDLDDAPHIVFIPSMFIFFTVLSLNYLGDVVRARFDVRESVL